MAATEPEKGELVTTGNSEIDKKIGGGLPKGSLTLIEGQSDAGKSVLAQQFTWGSLHTNQHITLYTTENTTTSLIRQMKSLALDVQDFYICGRLDIFPVPYTFSEAVSTHAFNVLLSDFAKRKSDIVIVDSITTFLTHSTDSQALDFISSAKGLCDDGRSLVLTMHSFATDEQLLMRVRSICDAHLRLRVEEVGTQLIKVLEVSKVRGASMSTGNIISFDVEPNFGMKIIPISRAKG